MRRQLVSAATVGSAIGLAGLVSGPGLAPGAQPEQPSAQPGKGPVQPEAPRTHQLAQGLEALEPFVGYVWEIETEWVGGDPLKARNEYRAIMGGKFVEATTSAYTADGSTFQRHRTIFAFDQPEGVIKGYTFDSDGKARVANVDIGAITDGGANPPLRSAWVQDFGGQRLEVRQEVRLIDEYSYAWKVWLGEPGSAAFEPMMDGVWKRGERLID